MVDANAFALCKQAFRTEMQDTDTEGFGRFSSPRPSASAPPGRVDHLPAVVQAEGGQQQGAQGGEEGGDERVGGHQAPGPAVSLARALGPVVRVLHQRVATRAGEGNWNCTYASSLLYTHASTSFTHALS